ncbi:hypothetical protein DYB25_008317 [Aphanomyces astaci]|uniref:BZIP domain-containing protein n=1 Tax=Aphanomyces astaci TaxID=112090 RepID=A0A397B0U2_APHAT|nr:hypothetical protein DYB25_008317 [Aphanomyces astaci]RHY74750.1 hypothetical protein DYB34_010140 [Aphanomyces astaci]
MSKAGPVKKATAAAAAIERGPEWRYFGSPEFEEEDAVPLSASVGSGGVATFLKPPKKIPRVRCMYCHVKISARSNSLRRHLRVKVDKMNFPVEPSPPPPSVVDHNLDMPSAEMAPLHPQDDTSHDPPHTPHENQDTEHIKATQRRLKNRLACRANRKRKKVIRETLKIQVTQLCHTNAALHQEIHALLGYALDDMHGCPSPNHPLRHHAAYDPTLMHQDNRRQQPQQYHHPSNHEALPVAPTEKGQNVATMSSAATSCPQSESPGDGGPVDSPRGFAPQTRMSLCEETAASFFRTFVGIPRDDEPATLSATSSATSCFYSRESCDVVGERATFCDAFVVGPHVSLESIWTTKAQLLDELRVVHDVVVVAMKGDDSVVTVTIVEEGILRDVWALRALFNPTFVVTLQLHFAHSTPKVQLTWEIVCHCVIPTPHHHHPIPTSNVIPTNIPTARRMDVSLVKCDRL